MSMAKHIQMLIGGDIKPKRKKQVARPNFIASIKRPPKSLPMVLLALETGKKSRVELLRLDISKSGLNNVIAYMDYKGMIVKVPDNPNQPKAGMSYKLAEVKTS